MLKLDITRNEDGGPQSFMVSGDEPFRVDCSIPFHGANLVAHVYRGMEPDHEQEPCLIFDGNVEDQRNSVSLREGHYEEVEGI